ncbi:transcription initiation factor TFIID subunit 11 [Savitreella phatthalungensis]
MESAASPGSTRRTTADGSNRQGLRSVPSEASLSETVARLSKLRDVTHTSDAPSLRLAKGPRSKSTSMYIDVATPQADFISAENGDSEVDEADFGEAQDHSDQDLEGVAADKARVKVLLDCFDKQQIGRYEVYRRAVLNKANVRRVANQLSGQTLSQNIAVVIAGSAKVFVGEIVELALAMRANRGSVGPLAPLDLQEAYRAHRQMRRHVTGENDARSSHKRRVLR